VPLTTFFVSVPPPFSNLQHLLVLEHVGREAAYAVRLRELHEPRVGSASPLPCQSGSCRRRDRCGITCEQALATATSFSMEPVTATNAISFS
jgi:hypothetical protein